MSKKKINHKIPLHDKGECLACDERITDLIKNIEGVSEAKFNSKTHSVSVTYDERTITETSLKQQVKQITEDVMQSYRHCIFYIQNFDCPSCSEAIERGLKKLDGVHSIVTNFATSSIYVEFLQSKLNEQEIASQIERLGYKILKHRFKADIPENFIKKTKNFLFECGGIKFTTSVPIVILGIVFVPASFIFFAIAFILCGFDIIRRGITNLIKTASIDFHILMTVSCTGAVILGELFEATAAMALLSLAEAIESFMSRRTTIQLEKLSHGMPQTAFLRKQQKIVAISIDEIAPGDLIFVKPGDRVPVDGIVKKGNSVIDESTLTGEPLLSEKFPGEKVYAGSINGEGALEIEASKTPRESVYYKLINKLKEAQLVKSPSKKLVDKFAGYFTPLILSGAFLCAVVPSFLLGGDFNTWFYRAIILIAISCPCALVISTPITILSAMFNASKSGILCKEFIVLEEIGKTKAVVFDKTGTLTTGHIEVTEVISFSGFNQDKIIEISASLACTTIHPISQAILKFVSTKEISYQIAKDSRIIPGQGIKGYINEVEYHIGNQTMLENLGIQNSDATALAQKYGAEGCIVSYVIEQRQIIGIVVMRDTIRTEAKNTIMLLSNKVKEVCMLTGDNYVSAKSVADATGIKNFYANCLPDRKIEVVEQIKEKYGKTLMVGDGVNDAPAMARANFSVGLLRTGSEVSNETAQILLLQDNLHRLPFILDLSRKIYRVIMQNIAIAFCFKIGVIGLTLTPYQHLSIAVLADVIALIAVSLNGLRLLFTGRKY